MLMDVLMVTGTGGFKKGLDIFMEERSVNGC